MHDSQIFRRLRVNSLICTNSGLFSIKTSNFTTFRPISQVANSCRIISHLYRNITDAPEKIRLIEKKSRHRDGQTIFKDGLAVSETEI